MPNIGSQIAIWDTSAINRLAEQSNRNDLIDRLKVGHTHWIPVYIFDEIAATSSSIKRHDLLDICKKLQGESTWSLRSPAFLIQDAVRMFASSDKIDWESLLSPQLQFEEAVASGKVFDDDLANVQREQLKRRQSEVEEFFAQSKTNYENLFRFRLENLNTLDEIIAKSLSMGLVLREVQNWCNIVLGQIVDLQHAERFAKAFPPVVALTYAFLIAHFHRNKDKPTAKPAMAIDLLAATYLPVCHKFISDDQDQQRVLRDVVRYCPLRTEVIWFRGDFIKSL